MRTPRFALLIHGSFLSCVHAIRQRSNAHYTTWLAVDALTKIFHSLAAGARVSLPSCAAMSQVLEQRSTAREKKLVKLYGVNLITQLHFVRLVSLMPYLGIRRMRFAKANARSS